VDIPKALAEAAALVATRAEGKIDAVLVHTYSGENCSWLLKHLKSKKIKVIVASSSPSRLSNLQQCRRDVKFVRVTNWHRGQLARIPQAVAKCLERGHLFEGERVLCLIGNGCADATDLMKIWEVSGEEKAYMWDDVVSATVELATEMASTDIEGRPVGAAFIIGDWKRVLKYSHSLMPNPFENYKANVKDRSNWDMIKKYAATFDGAFVVADDGILKAAYRRLSASRRIQIPKGLGTRHHAVAAMTAATKSKGVTVSQEDRYVRIFEAGKLIAKVNPSGKLLECMNDGI